MTGRQVPALPSELPLIVFRALYYQFDLRAPAEQYIAVAKGTPWYAGHSLTEVARQISAVPSPGPGRDLDEQPRAREAEKPMISLPAPSDAARLTRFLPGHSRWSVFWDKKHAVWRAAEDDPGSALYIESRDLDTVIGYISTHSDTAHACPAPKLTAVNHGNTRSTERARVLAPRIYASATAAGLAPGSCYAFGEVTR